MVKHWSIIALIIVNIINTNIITSYVICPDGESACNSGFQCCQKGSGYRCCPISTYCCRDGNYCCTNLFQESFNLGDINGMFSEKSNLLQSEKADLEFLVDDIDKAAKFNEKNNYNYNNSNTIDNFLARVDGFLNGTEIYENNLDILNCKKKFYSFIYDAIEEGLNLNDEDLYNKNYNEFMGKFKDGFINVITQGFEYVLNCKNIDKETKQVFSNIIDYMEHFNYLNKLVEEIPSKIFSFWPKLEHIKENCSKEFKLNSYECGKLISNLLKYILIV
jgi:hypothetical protein